MADQITTWKRLIECLETEDKVKADHIKELESFFLHIPTLVAIRLQAEYESLTVKTDHLLGKLFDKIDLSDKPLLCSYLKMMRSFAYFRIAQITYYVEGPIDIVEPDPIYSPAMVKEKWYDLSPILPQAGTIGWKAIMNHGLVKEEQQLLQTCLQLLSQKLQFLAIVSKLDRFTSYKDIIHKNGEKVAEKLFELIRDVAYDDESMIGLDTTLFELLKPFTDATQQAIIIEAIVQDLFKPHLLQKPMDEEIYILHKLISDSLMCNSTLQDILIQRLIEHLKCNIIRRKRRHSIEASQENGTSSVESLLGEICENDTDSLSSIFGNLENLKVSAKTFQSTYLTYWITTLLQIISKKLLTSRNSIKLINTCSILLILSLRVNLPINNLTRLFAKVVECTFKLDLDRLFTNCGPAYLMELAKSISSELSEEDTSSCSLVGKFFQSYLNRYLKWCVIRNVKTKIDETSNLVNFICDKESLRKDLARSLQYVCIHQLAESLECFKNKHNMIMMNYMECARACSKTLYKPIKRCSFMKAEYDDMNHHDESQEINEENAKSVIYVDALICILKIAIMRNDQAMLDSYGDQLIRLFSALSFRVKCLVESVKKGTSIKYSPLDRQLSKLLGLYIEHQSTIKVYLNYELIETISPSLLELDPIKTNGVSDPANTNKKILYKQLKAKLDELDERSKTSMDVYPGIINKQYNSVTNHSLSLASDVEQGKPCFHEYINQLRSLNEVSVIVLKNSSTEICLDFMNNLIQSLDKCDPLDHPKVLYSLLMLESLVSSQVTNDTLITAMQKELIPKISCSLVRITKTVELGPSIHAFTNSGLHRTNKGIQCCTYSACIKIYTLLMRLPSKAGNEFSHLILTEALQMCISANLMQYAKYSMRLHDFFIQLAFSIAELLKSIGVTKLEELLKSSMPVFLTLLTHLIRCLLLASDRQKLENIPSNSQVKDNGHQSNSSSSGISTAASTDKNYESQLELLALDIGRILNSLASLRVKLVEYAPHIISTYIKDIQRASCSDSVRLHLNEGIFRIFNLIDAHQKERQEEIIIGGVQRKTIAGRAKGSLFEMIHARLDQASREIFRDMYDNYNNFHRYLAKC